MEKNKQHAIPASYLILKKNNNVLLLRRFNTGYHDGDYSLIAGHIDQGESATATMVREAKEEANLDLKTENIKVSHIMHRASDSSASERIDIFFTAKKWVGKPEIMEIHKCDDLSWFDLDNLPKNTIPYIKQAIECTRDKIFYSEHGWK